MATTVISRIDCMRPSEYAKLFYALCAMRGAKVICQTCGYEEDWKNREDETMRCNCPDMNCSGVMVITINKEVDEMPEPASENETVECPKEKVHLGGVKRGQVISFAKVPYGDSMCPLSIMCKDPCEYKRII